MCFEVYKINDLDALQSQAVENIEAIRKWRKSCANEENDEKDLLDQEELYLTGKCAPEVHARILKEREQHGYRDVSSLLNSHGIVFSEFALPTPKVIQMNFQSSKEFFDEYYNPNNELTTNLDFDHKDPDNFDQVLDNLTWILGIPCVPHDVEYHQSHLPENYTIATEVASLLQLCSMHDGSGVKYLPVTLLQCVTEEFDLNKMEYQDSGSGGTMCGIESRERFNKFADDALAGATDLVKSAAREAYVLCLVDPDILFEQHSDEGEAGINVQKMLDIGASLPGGDICTTM